ncbi:MAG: hypothetical protein AAFN92_03370, partial [Bacteroidota bacterium]
RTVPSASGTVLEVFVVKSFCFFQEVINDLVFLPSSLHTSSEFVIIVIPLLDGSGESGTFLSAFSVVGDTEDDGMFPVTETGTFFEPDGEHCGQHCYNIRDKVTTI